MYKIFTESRKRRFLMRVSFVYIFLVLSGIQLLSANTGRAQGLEDIMVTIEVKQENLEYLLKKIEFQTELTFAYLPAEVNKYRRVTIKSGKQSVKFALDHALKNTDLSYRYIENSIILFPISDYKKIQGGLEKKEVKKQGIPDKSIFVNRKNKAVDHLSSKDFSKINHKRLILDVTGQVVDVNAEPLIGVNVQVKGTNKGTATDFDGRFSISDIDDQAILVFSYIGYESQEVAVNVQSSMTIVMQEDVQTLDEVVVVGYGTQKKSDLTGAVSSLGSDDIDRAIPVKAAKAIQGQMAGVTVRKTSGKPGAEYNINIRGLNSINFNNSPLVVIDGVVSGDLGAINPTDIKTIDVLKDASATAIYGSRGANGVVIVTTKKGESGKARLTYNV